jgi:hypothetical protein
MRVKQLYHNTGLLFRFLFLALLPVPYLAAGETPVGGDLNRPEQRHFDIYREGSHIGTHTISRRSLDDRLVFEARTRISVGLLGFELYRFMYDTREVWDGQGLMQLVASVDDDGKKTSIEGQRRGDRFVWSDGRTVRSHNMPVYPTNHWNAGVLGQNAVLNTLTGKINTVTILDEGRELLEHNGSSQPALRYRYDGELQLLSWYDTEGRWLAMRFTTDDGATIEYRCRNCSGQAAL